MLSQKRFDEVREKIGTAAAACFIVSCDEVLEMISEIESHRAALEAKPPEVVLHTGDPGWWTNDAVAKRLLDEVTGLKGDSIRGRQEAIVVAWLETIRIQERRAPVPQSVTASNSTAVLAAEIARLRAALFAQDEADKHVVSCEDCEPHELFCEVAVALYDKAMKMRKELL